MFRIARLKREKCVPLRADCGEQKEAELINLAVASAIPARAYANLRSVRARSNAWQPFRRDRRILARSRPHAALRTRDGIHAGKMNR